MPRRVDPEVAQTVESAVASLAAYMMAVHKTDMAGRFSGAMVPEEVHKKIIAALCDDSLGHTTIMAPRGAAKTTILQCYVEWKLGRASLGMDGFDKKTWAQNFRVIYVSSSAEQAGKLSNAIRETIESNTMFQVIFPKVKRHRDKWSEGAWKVRGNASKDPNFVATGSGGSILGSRCHLLLLDDIPNEECRTSDVGGSTKPRRDLIFWLETTAMPMLVPGGRAIMPCTRWYGGDDPKSADPAAWSVAQGWHIIKLVAIEECEAERDDCCVERGACQGHSFWPRRFTMQKLLADRQRNPMSFALQMQNDIVPAQGMVFEKEWFTKHRYGLLPGRERIRQIMATWDPGGTATGRSFTAGIVLALTWDWHYYILHMFRAKIGYSDLKKAIWDTARRWRCDVTVIENKMTGISAIDELMLDESFYGIIDPVNPPGQRGGPLRIEWGERSTVACSDGRVHLPESELLTRNRHEDWTETFIAEMLRYPERPDDIVMALAQLLYKTEQKRIAEETDAIWRELGPVRYITPPSERRVMV